MDWNDAVKGHWSVLPTISTQSCHHCEVFCEHTYKSNSFLVVLSLQVGWKDPKMGTMEGLRMKHWTKFYKLHVFFQGEINLQHTSCNLIWWLYIDNHMILFTYLQLMCYPHLFLPSKKNSESTPGILGSCHYAFPSLWRMVFNSGVGELLECGCLRTAWWWELGLLLRMGSGGLSLVGLMDWKPTRPKGWSFSWNFFVETFCGSFFWVGVQMSFWDGGEVVGVWFVLRKKESKASIVGY